MTIRRVNYGRSHSYLDDNGQKIPGVTTHLDGGIPKPALVNWAATSTVDYAIDHWDELSQMPTSQRQKALLGARYAVKDKAANKGTQIHKLAQKLVLGERVAIPDGLTGYVESYVRFLDEFDVEPILVETTIWHPQYRYCGTFDLMAGLATVDDRADRQTWLLDIKSNRSGIFGETALQLAGYRHAPVYLDEETWAEKPMPPVDRAGAVWVREDGYDLVPVEAGPDQFRVFLYAAQIAEFTAHSRDLIGEPVMSPTTSTFRLTRNEDEATDDIPF